MVSQNDLAVAVAACLLLTSCQKNEFQGPVVLSEGRGILNTCEIGNKGSSLRKSLSVDSVRTTFRERGVGTAMEYYAGRIVVDTCDQGDGERIERVSVLCGERPRVIAQPQVGREARIATGRGLELAPNPPSRESVVARYGEPARRYDSQQGLSLIDDIRNGIPYTVSSTNGSPEYLHYPGIGLAFVVRDGVVIKCSVLPAHSRLLWGY